MGSGIEGIGASDVSFLPIVSTYARELGVVEEINRLCGRSKGVNAGQVCLALILDTLTGRSPLFRLEDSFAHLDVELLLGKGISSSQLNDDAVGRVLENLYDVGTNKILSAVALRAVKLFDLDVSHVHQDTTSRSVYGDYELREEGDSLPPFLITHGFSKDKRPDLKQLIHSLLCVDNGIPIYTKCEDGNASDKVINKNLIRKMTERMAEFGQDDFVYVADSALVTKENLRLMDDEKNGFRFLSRLPMTFHECGDAIARGVDEEAWTDMGTLADESGTGKRKPARYHGYETVVTVDEIMYRTLVVHSDAHDERRMKKIAKEVEQDKAEMTRTKQDNEKIAYACLPDAQAAAERLQAGKYHHLVGEIREVPVYAKGRPKADGSRKIVGKTYRLFLEVELREDDLERAHKEAGCFVLITNEPFESQGGMSSLELLRLYKDQHSIEQNFAFLKDPLIVNALFLKSPKRIEALGLILVLALMVWRLMERTMRMSLRESGSKITGWDRKPTSRPTSFMMTTKFLSIIVLRFGGRRRLGNPLRAVQADYLHILGLSSDVFVNPEARMSRGAASRLQ
jgi:transposase